MICDCALFWPYSFAFFLRFFYILNSYNFYQVADMIDISHYLLYNLESENIIYSSCFVFVIE